MHTLHKVFRYCFEKSTTGYHAEDFILPTRLMFTAAASFEV